MGESDAGAAQRRRHLTGVALALAAGVLWSFGGLLIKWVEWNPIAIAGARSAIAAVVLLAFVRRPRFTWTPAQIGAALAYTVTVLTFVSATRLTTAANAVLLQYTAPVYAAIFGWILLRERVTWRDMVTIAVVLSGMALFFLDRLTPGGMLGNVLAVVSGASFSLMATLLRVQRNSSPLDSVLLGNLLTAIVSLPWMLGSAPGGSTWIGIVLLGVFQLGLSYVLFAEAVKRITALEAVLVPTVEPILSPLWVMLLLHETPGPWATAGGAVVLGAVTLRCAVRAVRGV
ncbi:MAG TPA: DMT family transporter [Chthonomonadales bacterium]|nr:DMT family transporter [Chthonomonadales bacterium]